MLPVLPHEVGRDADAEASEAAVVPVGERMIVSFDGAPKEQYGRALRGVGHGRPAQAIAVLERTGALGFRGRWRLEHAPPPTPIRDDPATRALAARDVDDCERQCARAFR